MTKSFILVLSLLMICCSGLYAQNTFKLFDSTLITPSDTTMAWNPRMPMTYATKDVYLSCAMGGSPQAYLTGPNSGNLIVDNFFTVNGDNICPDEWNCFAGIFVSSYAAFGLPVQSAYWGVTPIDIGSRITGSGVYTFSLSDYGYSFGSSEIYLHTSCSFGTEVCHRNNGRAAYKTLAVSTEAVAAHLAHGDTEGPCSQ